MQQISLSSAKYIRVAVDQGRFSSPPTSASPPQRRTPRIALSRFSRNESGRLLSQRRFPPLSSHPPDPNPRRTAPPQRDPRVPGYPHVRCPPCDYMLERIYGVVSSETDRSCGSPSDRPKSYPSLFFVVFGWWGGGFFFSFLGFFFFFVFG